ncbi:MAG: hypothetical protein L7S64_11205 [Longimicrobiales bacterium]|nr:hypothetical protein [Longimicrobiales bacterium]
MNSDDVSPWLIRGIYLFGFALILHAVIDLSTTVWPLRVTEMSWRYGFLGLGAGYLQTPTLGLLLIAGTALWQGDLGLARGVGAALTVSALVLMLAVALFMLDVVQVRQLAAAEAQAGVLYGGLWQAVKYVLASIILAAMGRGLIQSVKTARSEVPLAPVRGPLIGSAAAPPRPAGRPNEDVDGNEDEDDEEDENDD